jgi:hypothetical protein
MTAMQIFAVQFSASLFIYALIAKWFVAPRLAAMPLHDALVPLFFLHAFRHMGLVFLLPGFTGGELPREFAMPTAYGDLAMGGLSLLTIFALRNRWPIAIGLAWLASLVGIADFAWGNYMGIKHQVQLGAAYYIPTVVNPAMWVAHFLILVILIRRGGERAFATAGETG